VRMMPPAPPDAGVGAVTTIVLGLALAASPAYAQTPVVWPTAPVDGVCGLISSTYSGSFGMSSSSGPSP